MYLRRPGCYPPPMRKADIDALGARSWCDPRTVRKAYRTPWKCRPSTYNRIRLTAAAMGYPAPPARLVPVVVTSADPRAKRLVASGQPKDETDHSA